MITVADFKFAFPAFVNNGYTDMQIQSAIDLTVVYMGEDEVRWNNKYNTAELYLTAHLLIANTRAEDAVASGGIPSPLRLIDSKTAGGVSVNYGALGALATDDPWYQFMMSTYFGQQFMLIARLIFTPVYNTWIQNTPLWA